MSTSNGPGGAPQGSGGTDQEKENQDTQPNSKPDGVSYETYKKVLDEAKRAKERLSAIESEAQAKEKEQLEKSGKFQELYEAMKAENEKLKESEKKRTAFFVNRSVASQFKAEAAKAGCSRLDALEKLVDLDELFEHVDDDLNVKPDALKSFIEKSQKQFDFMFAKQAPGFRDAAPDNAPKQPGTVVDEAKKAKSQKELDAILKKHGF